MSKASCISDLIFTKLDFLEHPYYPSLGPHLNILGFIGLWPFGTSSAKVIKFKKVLFYTSIAFFFTQYIRCLIKFDSDSIKLVLQYAPFHMGIMKACLFKKDHHLWKNLISYTGKMERGQLAKENMDINRIMNEYITRNRKVTYFFWGDSIFSLISIFSEPYQKNQVIVNGTSIYFKIFDGYTPFGDEPPGYYLSMCVQTVLGSVIAIYIVAWDNLVVSIMIFYAGQLKIARVYCRQLIDASKEKSHQNIAEFHRFYITLIKYQVLFNSLISPVMTLYLLFISANLGVGIIQIVELRDDVRNLVSSIVFIVACLIQLLIFYWHSNEVTDESTLVRYSIFESDWVGMKKSLRKEMQLLSMTTTKRMEFDAGPFKKMSLATFVGILRASYSFYALMNGTNED